MATLRFNAKIEIRGINPYLLVSHQRARAIQPDWRKPMPVKIRVNGEPKASPWRINMMPVGDGSFYLYLHGDVRRVSNTKVGDRVRIEIEFDASYSGGPSKMLPTELGCALSADPTASRSWAALTPSRQKEIVRYIVHLKTAEARDRNVVKVVRMLASRGRGAQRNATQRSENKSR